MSLSLETLGGLDTPAAAQFLLSTYIDRTPPGRYRAKKLVAILQNLASSLDYPALRNEVAKAASSEVENTHDALSFRQLQAVLKRNVNEGDNQVWLERVERENRVKRSQLESNLAKAKSEGGKEGPRLALKDLGAFFVETGDGTNATRVLFMGKEFCTTNAAHLEMALAVMEASLEYQNYTYASTFAVKAEQLCSKSEVQKIKLVLALCDLERKKFRTCAKTLVQLQIDVQNSARSLLLPMVSFEDVSMVAVLCALATFTRQEVKEQVLESQCFKPMLELVPVLKDMVVDFCTGKYGNLVRVLRSAEPVLRLDPLLAPHGDFLLRQIFIQCVLQFVSPYSNVKLDAMAKSFALPVMEIQSEVAKLISQGQIGNFRIDAQNQLLVRKTEDDTQRMLKLALQCSETFTTETRSMLLRANLLENGIVYTSTGGIVGGGGKKLARLRSNDQQAAFTSMGVDMSSDED